MVKVILRKEIFRFRQKRPTESGCRSTHENHYNYLIVFLWFQSETEEGKLARHCMDIFSRKKLNENFLVSSSIFLLAMIGAWSLLKETLVYPKKSTYFLPKKLIESIIWSPFGRIRSRKLKRDLRRRGGILFLIVIYKSGCRALEVVKTISYDWPHHTISNLFRNWHTYSSL